MRGKTAALLELGSGFSPDFTGARKRSSQCVTAWPQLRRRSIERFNDIAAFADIGDFIEQPVKTYSSGMMMRLGFCGADGGRARAC